MKVIKVILTLVIVCATGYAYSDTKKDLSFANRKEVQNFIQEMSTKHGLDKQALTEIFKKFSPERKVITLISKPAETLPWPQYQASLVSEDRAKKGVLFWKQNKEVLKKVESQFGVPAEIIVAILGVESRYGQITGNYPAVQSLATLAFDYPRRAAFFRDELKHFLLLSKENALDPITTKGSYAGALGMPQFMPSNYRRYATTLSGKGTVDLLHNNNDVIASVANYFKMHGWKTGEIVAQKVSGKRIPTGSAKDKTKKIKLVALQTKTNTKEQWQTFHNFQVITRYNPSVYYAMAVYQLSQRIRALYQG